MIFEHVFVDEIEIKLNKLSRASSWVVLSQHHDLDFEHYYYILLYYHYRYTDTLSFSMHQIIITLVYTMITMFYGGARVAWHIKMPSFMKFHTKNYGVLLHKVTLSMPNSPIFDILMKILEIFFVWSPSFSWRLHLVGI